MLVTIEEKNQMKKKEVNIIVNSINTLKDEIINLKVIVMRNLLDEHEKLR